MSDKHINNYLQQKVAIGGAFRPSSPITSLDLFSGRSDQIDAVLDAVVQPGQHVILYGERGVGKTSLARIINEVLTIAGLKTMDSGAVNCDGTDDFSSLWHKLFSEISFATTSKGLGFGAEDQKDSFSLDNMLPAEVTPNDIRCVMGKLGESVILLIDELDRLDNSEALKLLADTIKMLSDYEVRCTIILIGVGESVDELISEHKSIDRALVQVPMPRMSQVEVLGIINKGLKKCSMTMGNDAKKMCVVLSQGLPHYTHSICFEAAQHAAKAGRISIETTDVEAAVTSIVSGKHSVHSAYDLSIRSPQKTSIHAHVLMACALTEKEDDGYFSSSRVGEQLCLILNRDVKLAAFSRHLNEFCSSKRGDVMERKGQERSYRYRFTDPLMAPYAVMCGIANELVSKDVIYDLFQMELNLGE